MNNVNATYNLKKSHLPAWAVITLVVLGWGCIISLLSLNPIWFLFLMALAAPVYFIALVVVAVKKKSVTGLAICLAISLSMWVIAPALYNSPDTDITPAVTTSIPSGEELRNLCKSYSYEDVSRYPDKYKNEYALFTGEVVQVVEQNNNVTLRLALEFDKVVYVIYSRGNDEPRLLEGDRITAYGVLDGLTTYESIFGEPITIPKFTMYEYDLTT
jgi:hypothetical protein